MPTMTETEDRLRHTLNVVASSVHDSDETALDIDGAAVPMAMPTAIRRKGRSGRRSPSQVFAAGFVAVLLFGAISLLSGGTESVGELDRAVDPTASSEVTSPTDEISASTTTPALEQTAVAEFWALTLAGWVDIVSQRDHFGPDVPEPEARVTESGATEDPFGAGGSMMATVVTAAGQLTIAVDYVGRGEAIDESALQAEVADLTAEGTAEHIDTIWHSRDTETALRGEGERAEFLLTEHGSGSTQVTVLTALGRLVVEVDATDPAVLFDTNQLMGIATRMSGTSLDLTWNPDHPLSVEVVPLPEPAADDWLVLDDDLWVAWVAEDEDDRLWVKSDVQDPISAPSTDTRSIHAFAGSQFVVIVVGDPVPEVIIVTWDDGSRESVEPTWNTDLDMGFARFDIGGRELVSVEGP